MLPWDQRGGDQAVISALHAAELQKDECSGGKGSRSEAEGANCRVDVSEPNPSVLYVTELDRKVTSCLWLVSVGGRGPWKASTSRFLKQNGDSQWLGL